MFRGLPPAQRRMVVLSMVALALSIAFVAFAVVFAVRTGEEPSEYRPFEIGDAAALGRTIATAGPIFFADPTGGERGFALALDDGEFAALHVVPPGGSADCPIDWDAAAERFVDCRGRAWASDELRRFPATIDDDGLVVVDLRRTRGPAET